MGRFEALVLSMKLELRHKSRYAWIQFNFRERRRSRPRGGHGEPLRLSPYDRVFLLIDIIRSICSIDFEALF